MQFLIVLAAALACAVADPQVAYLQNGMYPGYSGMPIAGYTGYTGYPGYGVIPNVAYPGYQSGALAPVAYSAQTGTVDGKVATYPVGYSSGSLPVGYVKDVEFKTRSRRDVPASTTKLEHIVPLAYTHPTTYTHPATYTAYTAPLIKSAYSPVGYGHVGAYNPMMMTYPQTYGSIVTY